MKRPKGFTLIELLVSTTLNLVVLSGLSAFLVFTLSFFKKQMLSADFQERLRFVFYVIGHDIENAGFLGCAKEVTNLPWRYGTLHIPPAEDELNLAYAVGDKLLKKPLDRKDGKYILASTCEKAVVFENLGRKTAHAELIKPIRANFQDVSAETQFTPITFISYSLDKKEKKLYRRELGDIKQEFLPDVCSFQVARKQKAITVKLTFKVGDSDLTEARTFYLANNSAS